MIKLSLEILMEAMREEDTDRVVEIITKSMNENELLMYKQIKAGMLLPDIQAGLGMGRAAFKSLKIKVLNMILTAKSPLLTPVGEGASKKKKKINA